MAFITEENYRKTKEYSYAKWLVENEEFLKRFLESIYNLKPVENELPKIDMRNIWNWKSKGENENKINI